MEEPTKPPPNPLFSVTNFKESDWIAAVFDDVWYPGIVEKFLDDGSFRINFMSRSDRNRLFLWPHVPDKRTLHPGEVLYVLGKPLVPVIGCPELFRVEEYNYIEFLKKNID